MVLIEHSLYGKGNIKRNYFGFAYSVGTFCFVDIFGKKAIQRAAFFPPTRGIEKIAYRINLPATFILLAVPFFLGIKFTGLVGFAGLVMFVGGLILYTLSIVQFARPEHSGINRTGLYRFSRNPMYVAFFIYFLGCCLLTRSWLFFGVLAIFQVSVHFLILSEERWCKNEFGEIYEVYFKNVGRYFNIRTQTKLFKNL